MWPSVRLSDIFIYNGVFMTSINNSDKRRILLYSVIALIMSALATAGRLFSLLFCYDDIGYYQSGKLLPILSNAVFAASVVFFGIAALFLLKPAKTVAFPNKAARYTALLPAVAIIIYLIFSAEVLFLSDSNILPEISAVFAIISALFFLSLAFCRQPSAISALLGVGCIFWLAICWFISYRDFTVPMNSPDKLVFHFGCIGAALFVFSEIRAIYCMSKPRFYYFSIFTAILSMSVSSIPSLIGSAGEIFSSYSLTYNDLFFLALTVYAVVRLITLTLCKPPVETAKEAQTESEEEQEAPLSENTEQN